jgi:AbrB family looped-hinge helix DNA binding protein
MQLTLDKAGRIVLPKKMRDELALAPGDELDVEVADACIQLRPRHAHSTLVQERGVWVHKAGEPLALETVERVLNQVRAERSAAALGGKP